MRFTLCVVLCAACGGAAPRGLSASSVPEAKPDSSSAGDSASSRAARERIPVKIEQAGNPVLRGGAEEVPVERIRTPEFQALLTRMIETMRAAPGVGLAAPQIGLPLQVIVLEDRASSMQRLSAEEIAERGRVAFGPRVFVNPVLTPIGEERATFFEGCLSVEGYTGLVSRFAEVEVRGLDEHGVSQTWRVRGWPARILQHEVDHLHGTLYVDRMLTRSFMTGDAARQQFAGKSSAAILQTLGLP